MKWINIKDRVPNDDRLVLVTDGKHAKAGSYIKSKDWGMCFNICSCCDEVSGIPTHWMELDDLLHEIK